MRKNHLIAAALVSLCGCGRPQPIPTPLANLLSPTPAAAPTASPTVKVTGDNAPKFRFEKARREDAPVRLTSSEGVGLQLVSYKAQAVVNGPLAFTELHLKFKNPESRVLEGRFEITLPEKAALSRLAMKNGQSWQEGEVVELQKARVAYEDSLHRRQDPALLEKQAGNQFQARVFPIPAQSEKELILSYSQELTSEQDYVLPIGGLPKIDDFTVEASLWVGPELPQQHLNCMFQSQAPEGDLAITRTSPVKGLANKDLTLLTIAPQGKAATVDLQDMLVLVDTSASRSAGYNAQLEKLEAVLRGLGDTRPNTKIEIAAFDQDVVPVYSGTFKGCPEGLAKLKERRPLGATDFKKALQWARQQKGYKRLLLVTDGVATTEDAQLESVAGLERVDALMVGGIRDSAALADLVYHKQAKSGLVLDGERSASELARSLLRVPLSGIRVEVKGAEWVWPEVLDGVEPGEERLVYAEVKSPKQEMQVTLSGGAQGQFKIPLTSVSWPLLQRAAVAAHLSRLNSQRLKATGPKAQELSQQMVEMSTRNRVVCDLTSLLVLETDADYARFGISRSALRDILVVGKDGVELQHREMAVAPPPPKPLAPVVTRRFPGERGPQAKGKADPNNSDTGAGGPAVSPPSVSAQSLAKTEGAPASEPVRPSGHVAPQPRLQADNFRTRAPAAPPPPAADRLERQSNISGYTTAAQHEVTRERTLPTNGGAPAYRRVRVDRPAPAPPPRPPVRVGGRVSGGGGEYSASDLNPRRRYVPPPSNPVQEVPHGAPALTGKLLEVHDKIKAGQAKEALQVALDWEKGSPGDVLALVALGEAYEAIGQKGEAGRAYGSIVDLYPGRADLRRFAGCRLEALGQEGQALAADSYAKALEQRPDHPASYRMRAYALVRLGHFQEAFEVLERGARTAFPRGRFLGCDRILREDLALVGAAWASHDPKRRSEIEQRVQAAGARIENAPSLRFVLSWETDANDVDFHIQDSQGGHAFYSQPELPSGGRLYADVTTGYGPECFSIPGKPEAGPYRIFIHYYSRGPMGYGMGKVEVVRHDGKGGLAFEERPYVVMNDQAFVDLGAVKP